MESNLQKELILDLDYGTLENQLKSIGQPSFRAKQIWVGLYKQFKNSPDEITTLSKSLREQLNEIYDFNPLMPVREIVSGDGLTVKTLFSLRDGNPVEAVLMYYDNRRTLCISSQSGCAVGCAFCATGQMGFKRNLSPGEITAQVLYYARMLAEKDEHVTNVVVMGMGEPFHNYTNVMKALWFLNNPDAFGLGARRITISTVGEVSKIKQFADEETQFNLAISLHTVDNRVRSELIPLNKKYPVETLLEACRYYVEKTSRRITFEIALMQGVNDSIEDAKALTDKIGGMICHVNLIPLNATQGFPVKPTPSHQVEAFAEVIIARNIPCTVRVGRGLEIQAGCGQLAAKSQSLKNQ